jgi:lysophospholipase L1-like esterase
MLIGSCFAENIGNYLQNHRFNALINPSGILFNPMSIYHTLMNCLENKAIDDSMIIERHGLFFSLLHHSSIYNGTREALLFDLKATQEAANTFLKTTDVLIITFGSAYAYEYQKTNTTVANCHKLPSTAFTKHLLSVEQITSSYNNLIQALREFNPKLRIIFTVSPVKYLKDGIEENNLSKSTLLLAINELKKETGVSYFPAYELVNDDLRDYRFYKEDMAHPNEQAIEYIWEKFSDAYFANNTKELNKEIASIVSSENHTLLFPESEEAKKFTANLARKKSELKSRFPFLEI